MKSINGIPVYEALVNDENTGMFVVSLVDFPAVESDFLAFAAEKKPLAFKIENEEKRIVRGVVMKADFPIYRCDEDGYEYYITYSAPTIRLMAQKFLAEGRQNDVDLQHSFELEEGVELVQIFIKDSANGINPKGFEDCNDGSLFAEYHVMNDEIWSAIKEGTYKGFSLAGTFNIHPVEMAKQTVVDEIDNLLDAINNRINKK